MNQPPRPSDETLAALVREAPVEPVDELTRRRMIARALDLAVPNPRAHPERRFRVLAVAAIAVVALGVVSTLAVLSDGGNGAGDVVAQSPFGLPISADQVAADAGALDDPGRLHATLLASEVGTGYGAAGSEENRAVPGGGGANLSADTPAPSGGGVGETPATGGPAYPAGTSPDETTLAAIGRCYRSLADSIPETAALTTAATGTYQGRQVVVLGFRSPGDRLLAMVLARADCSILSAQSFK